MDTVHDVGAEPKPGSPRYWGPLLWRMYHLLAEFPNNNSQIQLWKHILRNTARAMPCDKCREHLSRHLDAHPLKEDIRTYLWNLHNQVNIRNESPAFSYEELSIYAIQDKTQTMLEIKELFTIIQGIWKGSSHYIQYPVAYNDWKKQVTMIIGAL